jgi:hypothetical protein
VREDAVDFIQREAEKVQAPECNDIKVGQYACEPCDKNIMKGKLPACFSDVEIAEYGHQYQRN